MKLLDVVEDLAHIAVRIVYHIHLNFKAREKIFREFHQFGGMFYLQQVVQIVDRLIKTVRVLMHRMVIDKAALIDCAINDFL